MAEAHVLDGSVARNAWVDAQRNAVIEEMNRIICYPTFKSSQRCVDLLRSLVQRALDGDQEGVKERTLGMEVFGRDPDYDTNVDPIVRKTANEIRKRLAQCYEGPDADYALRIHLVRGSYLLEFDFASANQSREPVEAKHPEQLPVPSEHHQPIGTYFARAASLLRRYWYLGIATAVLVSAGWMLLMRVDAFRSSQYKIWKPLLDSGVRITVCLSDLTPMESHNGTMSSQQMTESAFAALQDGSALTSHGSPQDASFTDVLVAYAIVTRLSEFERQTNLQSSSAITFKDFRQRPAVLIGGLNNPWTRILLSGLRYTLCMDPITQDKWIQDAQNPSMRNWRIDGKLQTTDTFVDYAVITRFFDRDTGQWILALSGLEAHGTDAAGELVTDTAFAKLVPRGVLSKGNFQIVLRTSVVRGNSGPFEVLAVYTW